VVSECAKAIARAPVRRKKPHPERAGGGRAGGLASLSRDLTVSKLAALAQRQIEQKAKVRNRSGRK
jgi:hypothetical protein